MTGLLDLPAEILIEILSHLDIIDNFNCRRTCYGLDNVISDSIRLRYLTKIKLAGMQDNPCCTFSIADRLAVLEDREASWQSVNWKFVTSIDVPSRWSGVYDVTSSVYLLGKSSPDFEYVTTGIQTIRLPTQLPDNQESGSVEWTEFNFGMDIIDFGTAIEEHDLLACVSSVRDENSPDVCHIVVVLLRYSTKKMHEACISPVIHICRAHRSEGLPSVSIEVVGENLAVVVVFNQITTRHDFLHVFDWKTGKSKSDPLPVNNIGLTFLREEFLVNPNVIRESIDIYHIPPSSSLSTAPVRLIHSYLLPTLKPGHRITNVSCRSDPNPTANGTFPKNTRSNRPFANDPACAIIIFTFEIRAFVGVGTLNNFVMIVHRKVLLDQLPPFLTKSPPAACPRSTWQLTPTNRAEKCPPFLSIARWKSWGPPNTRWFNADDFPTMFITTTAGQRCVQFVPSVRRTNHPFAEHTPGNQVPDTIFVLDFNPWRVKLARHQAKFPNKSRFVVVDKQSTERVDGESSIRLEDEPKENICFARGAFEENIVGRLPYLACKAPEKWDYDAVLLDEERILGIRSYDDPHQTASVDVIYLG